MRPVIITNGYPGCGKDKFAELLGKYTRVYKTSIIDFAKDIAREYCGEHEKDTKYREFLCRLKSLFDWYNDFPFRNMEELVNVYRADKVYDVLIIDMRDPDQIRRAQDEWGAISVYISSPNAKRFDNPADNNVEDYDYDYYVFNPGDESFEETVLDFKHIVLDGQEPLAPEVEY